MDNLTDNLIMKNNRHALKKYLFITGLFILLILISISVLSFNISEHISRFPGFDTASQIRLNANINHDEFCILNLEDTVCEESDDETWGIFEIKVCSNSEISLNYSAYVEIPNIQSSFIEFFVLNENNETPIFFTGGKTILEGLSGTFWRNDSHTAARAIKWKINNHKIQNIQEFSDSNFLSPNNVKISLVTYPAD